jgi:hypothetical protein
MGPKGVLPQKRLLLNAIRPTKDFAKRPKPATPCVPLPLQPLNIEDPKIESPTENQNNAYMQINGNTLLVEKNNKVVKLNLTDSQRVLLGMLF